MRAQMSSFHLSIADCHAALGRSHPEGREGARQRPGSASRGLQAPSRGERPRTGPGMPLSGARSLAPHTEPRQPPRETIPELGLIYPAPGQPGARLGRLGSPALPPALGREAIVRTEHLELVSPPAGSTCPSPSDALPPERSLQNKSALCINKAARGVGQKSSAQELHECSFLYKNKYRSFFCPSKTPRPKEGFLHLITQFPPPTTWEPNLSC